MDRPRLTCLGGISGGEPHADGAVRRPPIREPGFRPQGTGEDLRAFPSAIWRRRQGIRASPFGAAHGLNLRRDGMAGCPQASTRRPGRSLMSEPSGRTDRGLKDGAGLVSRKRSVRMASEECALAVRSGAHPGPTQVPPGGWSEGGTPGAVGCSALPASPEAGFAPRRRSILRLLDARSGLAAKIDWERPRRFFVPEPLPAPEASVNAPFRGAWRAGSLKAPRA